MTRKIRNISYEACSEARETVRDGMCLITILVELGPWDQQAAIVNKGNSVTPSEVTEMCASS